MSMYDQLIYAAAAALDAEVNGIHRPGTVTLREGRAMYVVSNNPERLIKLAKQVKTCPGWTGNHIRPKFGVKHFRINATSEPVTPDII